MVKLKIGISACLTGANVRYNGGNRASEFFTSLNELIDWVAICPETEAGMGVPRKPMQLVSQREGISKLRLVTIETGKDMTEVLTSWCKARLRQLRGENLCGFIFKSRSPSCGISGVEATANTGTLTPALGLFANAFINAFPDIPVQDDERMSLPEQCDNFFARALLCHEQDMTKDYLNTLMQRVRENQSGKSF